MTQVLGANSGSVTQTATILNNAAQKYNVPPATLFGVWGLETSFGQNVKTSSAGAVGDFQFLPSTAAGYGYPLTNTPNMAQFQQQADAAAHYLSDLFHRTGSWDAALKAYSGGGYGLAQVQAKAETGPGNNLGGVSVPGLSSINPAGGVSPNLNLPNPLTGIDAIANLITSGSFWLRVGEALAGAVLLILGLRALSGGSGNPVTAVKSTAGSAAATAAKVVK